MGQEIGIRIYYAFLLARGPIHGSLLELSQGSAGKRRARNGEWTGQGERSEKMAKRY